MYVLSSVARSHRIRRRLATSRDVARRCDTSVTTVKSSWRRVTIFCIPKIRSNSSTCAYTVLQQQISLLDVQLLTDRVSNIKKWMLPLNLTEEFICLTHKTDSVSQFRKKEEILF